MCMHEFVLVRCVLFVYIWIQSTVSSKKTNTCPIQLYLARCELWFVFVVSNFRQRLRCFLVGIRSQCFVSSSHARVCSSWFLVNLVELLVTNINIACSTFGGYGCGLAVIWCQRGSRHLLFCLVFDHFSEENKAGVVCFCLVCIFTTVCWLISNALADLRH